MRLNGSMKNMKSNPMDAGFGSQHRTAPDMGNSALKESPDWRTAGFMNGQKRKLSMARNLTIFAATVHASTLTTLKKFHVLKITGAA